MAVSPEFPNVVVANRPKTRPQHWETSERDQRDRGAPRLAPRGPPLRGPGPHPYSAWPKSCWRTHACMAMAAAADALIDRVDPNWVMCNIASQSS